MGRRHNLYTIAKQVYIFSKFFRYMYKKSSRVAWIDEELVLKAFRNSVVREKDLKGLIIHTDRGSQYTSRRYQNEVREIGGVSSMSRAGNPYDNALMESFYKTLKTELLINGSFETEEEAKNAIFEYIEIYYNRQRLHSSLGYLSPVEYEEKFFIS